MLEHSEIKEPATEDVVQEPPSPTARRRHWIAYSVTAVVLVAFAIGIYAGIHRRSQAEAKLAVLTREDAVPTVKVIHPLPRPPDQEVVLPGNMMAYTNAPIYARTSGYLKRWYFDIGSHVKQGDLLAEIETPEVDEQLRRAQADLVTAQANTRLSAITAK